MDTTSARTVLNGTAAAKQSRKVQDEDECVPNKRQKITPKDTQKRASTLSEAISVLCDDLLSQASYLLRKATLLRITTDVHLSHDVDKEKHQAQDQARSRRILQIHDHLNRLEVEHAKALVMIEQIRRCKANPYPAWDPSQTLDSCLQQTGPLVKLNNGTEAYSFPLYLDRQQIPKSPYVEHFERWLIPNPDVAPTVVKVPAKEVSTRGCNTDDRLPPGTGSVATMSDDSYSANASKPVLHPLVMKNSQGQWILLRCWAGQCGGSHDFKNVQGFVNHRRTLHGIRHPSQLAAADDCGEAMNLTKEEQQAYEMSSSANKRKISRLLPGQSAVNYDHLARANTSKGKETLDVVRLASGNARSASEVWRDDEPAYESTVHPFNRRCASLPKRPRSQDDPDGALESKRDAVADAAIESAPCNDEHKNGADTPMMGGPVKECIVYDGDLQ